MDRIRLMETQGIEARNQTTQPGKPKAAVASEVFGNLLTKLFDRLAAGPAAAAAGESELDAALFRSKAPAGDAVARPEEPAEDRELSARTRSEDDDVEDDHHDDAVVAAVEADPRPAIEHVAKVAASAGAGTAQAEAGTANPVDAATLADAAADAEAATLALKPLPAPEAKGGPRQADSAATGQGAGPAAQTQNPIKVTVTEAPVRAQPEHPLAPGAALAAKTAGGDAVDLDVPAPTQPAATTAAGGQGANANSQQGAANGSFSQSNQGQHGMPFAAIAAPASGAASPVATAVHASFAAQLEASSVDLPGSEGAHQIFAAAPASTPGTANAPRNTAGTPALPQPPRMSALDQIAVDIKKAIAAGKDQITINLKPAELGRIEVKLDVGEDGQVSAQVRADRPETLELLQRDARGLERALQDAGLRADSGALSFGLRGENRPDGQHAGGGRSGGPAARPDQPAAQATVAPAPFAARPGDGRIDLHV